MIKEFNLKNTEELIKILNSEEQEQKELWRSAREIRNKTIGDKVYLRGIIEFSNICRKNCLYCGIRSGNSNVKRYRLSIEDIMECTDFIMQNNIPSIVLQSGELVNDDFKEYLIDIIKTIKNKYPKIMIT